MDLLVGVDGGQSSTSCIITDLNCNVLVKTVGGPSNHLMGAEGIKRLERALNKSLAVAIKRKPKKSRIRAISLGMTGISDNSQSKQIVKEKVEEIVTPDILKVVGDAKTIFMGATAGRTGISAYAGTGSTALGKNDSGEIAGCGGWGYIVDDEGGGYAIGRSCLRAAFRGADGYGPQTSLSRSIMDYFNCKSLKEMFNKIYKDDGLTRFEIADITPLVEKEAKNGDEVAIKILQKAGKELGKLVLCVARKLNVIDDEFLFTVSGGVTKAGSLIVNPFIKTVKETASSAYYKPPRCKPIAGALILCLKELGLSLTEQRLKNLSKI